MNNVRKICFIGGFSNGGTERATFLVANELCDKYEICLLNLDVYRPVFFLDKRIKMDYISKSDSILNKCKKIYQYLKRNKIDIVINVEADICMFTIPVSVFYRKCRYITWEHANLFQVHNRFIPYIRRYAIKYFEKYIVLTKRDRNNFINKYGNSDKIEHIYNTIDLPADVRYSAESKIILSSGHHLPIKNFQVIPEIGKTVFQKHSDWKWRIYGNKNGDCFEKLKSKIKEYGLENNIILCDRTNDLAYIYSNSAIYVMTSLMEGLPMVLLEAKTYKLPIVSFDIETGPSEIIDDGVNGFLVKSYDINIMAEKICMLIEDKELRQQFSDNAYVGIEKFDKDDIITKWTEIIEG